MDDLGTVSYNAGLLPLANLYDSIGIKGVWRPNRALAFNLTLSTTSKTYISLSSPGDKRRKDTASYLSFRFSYFFRPAFSFYASSDSTQNVSTLTASDVRDENYSVTNIIAGLAWDLY